MSDDAATMVLLAEASAALGAERDLSRWLELLVGFASGIAGTGLAAVTAFPSRSPSALVVASAERAREGDVAQDELGEGPGVLSRTEDRTVGVLDTGADERYPSWGPVAKDLGLRSALSVPVALAEGRSGSLTVYAPQRRSLAHAAPGLQLLAAHASASFAASRSIDQLSTAVETRHVIGLAQGMLMERFGLDEDRAFQLLRRYSQSSNVKLAEVARRVVATRTLPPL
jgi:hypothetical protein